MLPAHYTVLVIFMESWYERQLLFAHFQGEQADIAEVNKLETSTPCTCNAAFQQCSWCFVKVFRFLPDIWSGKPMFFTRPTDKLPDNFTKYSLQSADISL